MRRKLHRRCHYQNLRNRHDQWSMIQYRRLKSRSSITSAVVVTSIILSLSCNTAAFVVPPNVHHTSLPTSLPSRRLQHPWQPLKFSLRSTIENSSHQTPPLRRSKRILQTPKQWRKSIRPIFLRVLGASLLCTLFPRQSIAIMAQDVASTASTTTGAASGGVIPISIPKLLLSMAPLLAVVVLASKTMGLKLEETIVTSAFRTFFQLSILGAILRPIFQMQNLWLVLGHCVFMMLLAVQVACGKSNYIFPGQFDSILTSILLSVTGTGLFAFGVIIKPKPLWNPQYVIPMVGMLLGNSLNGMALAMNTLCRGLIEQGREIELYQSFGANRSEAMARLVKDSIRAGTLPLLNNMAVIGLVSIPGMMTGQILGGSPVGQAARYQAMIMYFIALATFGAILLQVRAISNVGVDPHTQLLQTDRFEKMPEDGVSFWSLVKSSVLLSQLTSRAIAQKVTSTPDQLEKDFKQVIQIQPLKQPDMGVRSKGDSCQEGGSDDSGVCTSTIEKSSVLEMIGLTRTIPGNEGNKILFQDLSFRLNESGGEIYLVSGPSGSGKSELLRSIGLLSPLASGSIQLDGKPAMNPSDWRRQVRYVPQYKVEIPGTPREFVHKITQFESWKHAESIQEENMLEATTLFLQEWGLKPTALDQEWSTLSGGEAQRMILAIALASKPRVLLLDESTSALDLTSKLAVEQSIDRYAHSHGIHAIWVSHDPGIAERYSSRD